MERKNVPRFYSATDEEIKKGKTVDIYYLRTKDVIETKGLGSVRVVCEVSTGGIPHGWNWGVLCGIEEEAHLFKGYPLNVYAMPEGSVFFARDYRGIREPVMVIEGPYVEIAPIETALIGLLCQASGISTAAARIRKAVGNKTLISFGIRRMHPAIAPMIDRAAYIGGFDGVSGVLGAELIGITPTGTMPHPLILIYGDQVKAWKAFDEVAPPEVPRVALVDTLFDEKIESLMAADTLKDRLWAVRLDTPGSRRGDFADIVREVRWELDLRGYKHVKIMVSGGLSEKTIQELASAGVDAFGVGTWVSNAETVDFGMDVVEVEGKPITKRGKMAGRKQVWRCPTCFIDVVFPEKEQPPTCPKCAGKMKPMLKPLVKNGKIVTDLPETMNIRRYVLKQLENLPPDAKSE